MTKEELKKEARDYADNQIGCGDGYYEWTDVEKAYLAGAEPREKQIADLEKNYKDLKEFYEKEYFEIADKTANERIKELEQYETEITVDDYSPYDENTWGMMHEEIFVPKNLIIDMLKEIYAYIENLKKENAELKERVREQSERISELTQELDDVINRFE